MTDLELDKLADKIASRTSHACRHHITDNEAAELRSFAQFWAGAKTTATRTAVGFIVLVFLGAVGLGIVEMLRDKLPR